MKLDAAVSEALLVACGGRTACILDASAASPAAARRVLASAACLAAHAPGARGLALVDVGASTFFACVPRLRARLRAAERVGACADALLLPLCAQPGDAGSCDAAAVALLLAAVRAVEAAIDCGAAPAVADAGEWQAAPTRGGLGGGGAGEACIAADGPPPPPPPPLRVRAELPVGACPVALAGWLLDYPVVYYGADAGALDGAPLLLCTAVFALPVRAAATARCAGALHRRLAAAAANATVESRVTFSCPLLRDGGEAALASGDGGAALLARARADVRGAVQLWVARLAGAAADADACRALPRPQFEWRVVSSPRVVV
jgi:hypothetical protein